jgi:hypothetical protein
MQYAKAWASVLFGGDEELAMLLLISACRGRVVADSWWLALVESTSFWSRVNSPCHSSHLAIFA